MKSLKERLLDAAKERENENHHTLAALLREAAGATPVPLVNAKGHLRRGFDPKLVRVLSYLFRENALHEKHREDTIGVLLRCGAFHAEDDGLQDGFVADLAAAIDDVKPEPWHPTRGVSAEKFKFGDLLLGYHFICWPQPGDNHGHGGFLGQQRVFVKCAQEAPGMPGSGKARSMGDVESTFPNAMDIVRLTFS